MVLPLIPLAIAGIGGGIAGGIVSSFFGGGSKKDYAVHETHAPHEHFAPVTTDARSTAQTFAPTYQYQIDSPDSSMTSKKVAESASSSRPEISPSRTQEGGAGISAVEGTDMTKLALIGAVGLIAYGAVSK